ncbi:hypothetical protein DVH24_031716 [Malus domestica]|uniref:Uncharacterized protein n=1 Tax=Malus domestica TaxID=3750 RepID=A0A498J0W4_MALDO|nr:hypothetical protein DVH24_031716 [Malus domestica]
MSPSASLRDLLDEHHTELQNKNAPNGGRWIKSERGKRVIVSCKSLFMIMGLFLFVDQRGLKESDVDSFVDDVLVNDRPWASGVQESLTGPHVFALIFVYTHMSREEWNRDSARVRIDKLKEEFELRGLTNQVFVTACFHLEGHNYAGIFTAYDPDGSMTYHWYPFVSPGYVPELLDEHIGKGEIIERHWRGQMGASSDEAEEINDRELQNGEENKKNEDKPQENGNQIHQEKGNQIENNENFSGYCQGANSEGFTYCKKVSLEEDGGSEDKKPKETTESCVRKDVLRKLSSLIGNWEQSDVLATTVVVGAVATVAVAYSFYRSKKAGLPSFAYASLNAPPSSFAILLFVSLCTALPTRPHPCAFSLDLLPAIHVLLILERKKDGKSEIFHLLPQISRSLSSSGSLAST